MARAIASAVWRQHPRYRRCQDPEVAERRRYAKEMREKVQAGEKVVRGSFRTRSSGPVKTRDEGVRYDALGNEIPPQPGPDYFWHADCRQWFKRPSGRVRLPRMDPKNWYVQIQVRYVMNLNPLTTAALVM